MAPRAHAPNKLRAASRGGGRNNDRSDLTARQRNILDHLVDFVGEHGYPPTVREIGTFFGIKSTNGVSDHLRALERKGYISRSDGQSRGLTLLKGADGRAPLGGGVPMSSNEDAGTIEVPVVGRVAAGLPLLAVQNVDEKVRIDPGMVGDRRDVFGLRVTGRSMIDAGIFEGDLVFVAPRADAQNGRIVVAMIDGEATVKRFFREPERVRLQPENRTMEPIFVQRDEADDLRILGEVVGVYRRLH